MKIYINFNEFITERLHVNTSESLILEGGAAGHMSHPFDEKDLKNRWTKCICYSTRRRG